ncbi:MAG: hypothetical protein KC964_20640 [Candidatus Omnitrophica bacterium]|nr:hypothetical protein [Candidatus Omnitrophota bacterium]
MKTANVQKSHAPHPIKVRNSPRWLEFGMYSQVAILARGEKLGKSETQPV